MKVETTNKENPFTFHSIFCYIVENFFPATFEKAAKKKNPEKTGKKTICFHYIFNQIKVSNLREGKKLALKEKSTRKFPLKKIAFV
jgi:hypothetical protein